MACSVALLDDAAKVPRGDRLVGSPYARSGLELNVGPIAPTKSTLCTVLRF